MQPSDRIGLRMTLHNLGVLIAVVQAGSMGKAAAVLNTTQPAVSRSIAELERTIGVRLLVRNPKASRRPNMVAPCSMAVWRHSMTCAKRSRKSSFSPTPRLEKCGSGLPPCWLRASFRPLSIGSPGAIRAWCFIS